ncbi:MAG: GTPase HflX, partial [Ardenticatenaceae bacterium]|nr:GTPase HflX [Ardenticatenaceae bacterium]
MSTKTQTYQTIAPRERAFLVGVEIKGARSLIPVDDSLEELARLADTAGIDVLGQTTQSLERPYAATYIGPGKIEEVQILVEELKADVI